MNLSAPTTRKISQQRVWCELLGIFTVIKYYGKINDIAAFNNLATVSSKTGNFSDDEYFMCLKFQPMGTGIET